MDVEKLLSTAFLGSEKMSYSVFNKFGWGNGTFLDQTWNTNSSCLTVDTATGNISGTVPANAKGYYINVEFTIGGYSSNSSSVFVNLE